MHLLGKRSEYPNLRSTMRPVPHSDDLPVPTPPVNKDLLSSSDEEMPSREHSAESISLEDIESTYSGISGNEPHWITPENLNDLARDLCICQNSSQSSCILGIKQWKLVQEDVRIISFRNRNKCHWSSYGSCKRASQSTVVFSVSGIVELNPAWYKQKWIRCFFLLFTSNLVWWRISWRRCTKMVLPSNTCLLCSQVLVLLSSKRASLWDLRSEKCRRILILRSFLT